MSMKISASILAAELIDLKKILLQMDPKLVDFIHLDVMDGHFVPQLTFGESYAREIADTSPIPLDVHLMVLQPEKEVPKYFPLRPKKLSFHLEATHAPIRLLRAIRNENICAGVAISPATPVEALQPLIEEIDLIVLMSVEPGYYGQKFLSLTWQKLEKLKALIQGRSIEIEVDGGINLQNIAGLQQASVDIAVTGAACFATANVNENVCKLKAACQGVD